MLYLSDLLVRHMTVTRGIIFIFLKPFFIFRSEAFLYLSKLCIFLHTVLCPSSYLFIWWSHTFPAPIQKTNFHFTLFYNMQQKQISFLRTGNTPSSLYSIPSTHSALQILDHGRSFWSLGRSRAEQSRTEQSPARPRLQEAPAAEQQVTEL